jgi:hypothetical protein
MPFFPNLRRSPFVLATCAILLLHGGLLASSIKDYRVTIDSAYHVSIGREYGEHGLVPWDAINFGPRGRPNLQGPLLHAAIGGLGRLLGGSGDDYVLANATLAVIQWAAAMGTAAFFAYRLAGEVAMLLAVALLSGAAFAGTSFAIGIPSGWLFIFSPWAIWFFLHDRILFAAIATAIAIYSHLGGYLTAPVGIAMAGLMTRRWRQLFECGAITLGLTLPYTIHIIRYLDWLSGVKSHSELLFDPMLDVLAIAGAIGLLAAPRDQPFMVAWLLAPIVWLFQDAGRFLLQWPLGGSVAAGWLLANKLACSADAPHRIRCAIGIAVVATLLPFGLPSLSGEIAWAAGTHYPLAVDWRSARSIAENIDHAVLAGTLVADYSPALCPAIAVYTDISCEKGSWVEVQPRFDPADYIAAAQKTYIIPLRPGDAMLQALTERGLLAVSSSGDAALLSSSVVRLVHRLSISDAAALASATISAEARWLGRNAINNMLSYSDFEQMLTASGRDQFRLMLATQRVHAGRVELVCLLYASALEPSDSQDALAMRQIALKLGVVASYLSDDFALEFLGQTRFAELREQFYELATRSNRLAFDPAPSPELMANFNSLVNTALRSRGDMFPGRPAGDWLSWLSG